MKVDLYISSLSGGGAEKVLVTLAKKLAEQGNNVSVISLEKRPQFYDVPDSVRLYKYDNNQMNYTNLKDFCDIRKHMRKSNADISISFLNRCNLLVLFCGLFSKRKIVVCDRNNPKREHSAVVFTLSNLLYLRADKVMVQTKQIKSFYWKLLQNKIGVIENPIDTEFLNKQVVKPVEREKTIISVGRLENQKDFKTLIFAFSKISKKYPDWQVKIFGKGDMAEELEAYIDELGLGSQVKLCGRTQTPYLEMRKASVFVLSSHYEGFPNVLCEALYAGDLCIASDCVSGPRELITDWENGWLFEVGDSNKLANLMDYCMSNADEISNIRTKAEQSVERLYLDNNILEWNKMIEEVVSK